MGAKKNRMSTGEKIQAFLDANRLTQMDLAKASGVYSSRISEVVLGKKEGTLHVLLPIARAMNVSLDDLVDEEKRWPLPSREDRGVVLSAEDRQILDAARILGHPEAMRRLFQAGSTFSPSDADRQHGDPRALDDAKDRGRRKSNGAA